MLKKKTSSSLKKLHREGDKPAATVKTKPVPKPGKLWKEIDGSFSGRKKKKPELETNEKKEIDALQETKPVPKPGKIGKEIDDIFAGRNRKKSELETTEEKEIEALEQSKPVPKPWKLGKEIDDIFAGRKKKKPELETTEKKETPLKKAELAKRKKRKRSELDGFNNNPKTRPRKRTEDGLVVFTEEELGVNKANAGYTRLCPFNCRCCF